MSITISDLNIKDNSKEISKEMTEAVKRALEMCGLAAEGYAKVNITEQHAIDTGNLRNSITHKVDTKEECVWVGTNVKYGKYVELGTGKFYPGGRDTPWHYQDIKGEWHRTEGMKARPFLKPAVADHAAEYKKTILDEIKGK